MCDDEIEQEISDVIVKCLYMGYALPGFTEVQFRKDLGNRAARRAKFAKAKEMLKKRNQTADEQA